MSERDKLIEAMARAICAYPDEIQRTLYGGNHREWENYIDIMDSALIAIAEQGYAVVPLTCPHGDFAIVNMPIADVWDMIIPRVDIAKADLTP